VWRPTTPSLLDVGRTTYISRLSLFEFEFHDWQKPCRSIDIGCYNFVVGTKLMDDRRGRRRHYILLLHENWICL